MKKGQVTDWSEWAKDAKKFRDIPIGTAFRSGPGYPVRIKVAEPTTVFLGYTRMNAYPAVPDRKNHWAGKAQLGASVFVKEVSPDEIPVPCGAD